LGEAGFGDLVGTLPAENGTYTRYSTFFNQIEFNQILSQGLFLRSNLSNLPLNNATNQRLTFPNGAIDLKSSWIDMANVPNPQRYYTRVAWVFDPFTPNPTCAKITVGLVGLHIVQKTPSRPQWIWSTFEQIDNVPSPGGSSGPFTYNNGNGAPMPAVNPNPFPPVPTPTVFNVQRLKPVRYRSIDVYSFENSIDLPSVVSCSFWSASVTYWGPTV